MKFKPMGMSNIEIPENIQKVIINLKESITEPPILISGGYDYNNKYIPVMTEGNFSAIVGLSKSRKSFLKSAIMSLYIGKDNFNEFKGHRELDRYIIDIDTEQSKYHVQKVFKRTQEMSGYYKNYIPVSLREYEPRKRLKILREVINFYSGNIGLISIDGFADLTDNFNSIDQTQEVINALMKWTTQERCHITGIIHLNPSKDNAKPQGHLGSFILRKAETIIEVEKDNQDTIVRCGAGRNLEFKSFKFNIQNGIPIANYSSIHY